MESPNPHAAPPAELKELFKTYQKLKSINELDKHLDLIDFEKFDQLPDGVVIEGSLLANQLLPVFQSFAKEDLEGVVAKDANIYAHQALPGKNRIFYCFESLSAAFTRKVDVTTVVS